jgi:CRP-like cAMP-binding protein
MSETLMHTDLKKIALFTDLPDEMLAQLASEVQETELSAEEVLFNEGDEGDCLYFIRRGEVEIFQASDGKIFELLDEGDSFGEMSLFEAKPRSASARARTKVSLLRLDQKPFMALLEKNPQMALKVTSTVSARLRTSMGAAQPDTKAAPDAAKIGSNTKVFISYSRRDKPFVLKLNEALSEYGIDTWVDWENIPLTADWWNEIQLGIENADAFAFVISPDSLTSEVCGR